jgi:hypothetical protein
MANLSGEKLSQIISSAFYFYAAFLKFYDKKYQTKFHKRDCNYSIAGICASRFVAHMPFGRKTGKDGRTVVWRALVREAKPARSVPHHFISGMSRTPRAKQ